MKYLLAVSVIVAPLLFSALPARAGECYEYPTRLMDGSAEVKSAVFLRSTPCMDDSVVLTTLAAGTHLPVTGEQDGWYRLVTSDGTEGWVWNSFVSVSEDPLTYFYGEHYFDESTSDVSQPEPYSAPTSGSLLERTKGRILLQVEQHGEAWYVHPDDNKRYYMKDGPTAYEMMRAFGLGITNADLERAFNGDPTLLARLKGRIVLQVEEHGEAYYFHPEHGAQYLKDGEAAYEIMREYSLGITDNDLAQITSSEFVPVGYDSSDDASDSNTTDLDEASTEDNEDASDDAHATEDTEVTADVHDIHRSSFTHSSVSTSVDIVSLNEDWLETINDLRATKGLRQLVLDQRFVDSTALYGGIMADAGTISHTRPDGSSMHEWIQSLGYDFTEWGEEGGWETNYFSENLAWGPYGSTQSSFQEVLDVGLTMFLNEGPGGDHYDTIYHPDWNSVGVGFAYFNGKTVAIFHYGSLE